MKISGRATTGERPPLVLAGVDQLAGRLRLTGGRLPRGCDASRCEVVAVAGARVPARLRLYDVRLRVVGSGKLDSAPLGPLPPPAGPLEAGSTVLVTDGVAPLLAVRELDPVPRTFTWTRLLDPATVHPWNAGRVLEALQSAEAAFAGIVDDAQVAQPTAPVRAEAARGRAAAAFALIAAGLAATVLLAFAAFAAAEQRDDVTEELRRLRAMAARRRDLAALVVGEAAVPAFVGVPWGWRSRSGRPGWWPAPARPTSVRPLRRALHVRRADHRPRPLAGGDRDRRGVLAGGQSKSVRIALEAGCLVALAALVWQAASRGQVDARTLAAGGTVDPTLVLAPGAAALACGLLALRIVPPLLRGLARAAERLPVAPYLALVALARQPGRTAAAVAVVAVAGAAGTFALGHARTLQEGTLDQAAYRTAADVRGLAPSPGAKPGTDDSPVVRIEAEGLGQPLELQLLGVAAPVLSRLPGWREDFSDVPIAELAKRLDGDEEGVRLRGVEIPRDARELHLPVRVSGASAMLQLAIQRRDGTFGRLLPARDTRPGRATLVAPVPPADRGGTAVAFEVTVSSGGSGTSSLGEVEPGTLTARRSDGTRTRLTDFADGFPPPTGASTRPTADGASSSTRSPGSPATSPCARSSPPRASPSRSWPRPGWRGRSRAGPVRARARRRPDPAAHRRPHQPHADRPRGRDRGRRRRPPVRRAEHAVPGARRAITERWRDRRRPQARRRPASSGRAALARAGGRATRSPAACSPRLRILARCSAPSSPSPPRGPRRRRRRARPRRRAGRAGGDRRPARARCAAQMVAGRDSPPHAAGLLAGVARRRRPDRPASPTCSPSAPTAAARSPSCSPAFPWPLAVAAIAAVAAAAVLAASLQARRAFRGDSVGRLRG